MYVLQFLLETIFLEKFALATQYKFMSKVENYKHVIL